MRRSGTRVREDKRLECAYSAPMRSSDPGCPDLRVALRPPTRPCLLLVRAHPADALRAFSLRPPQANRHAVSPGGGAPGRVAARERQRRHAAARLSPFGHGRPDRLAFADARAAAAPAGAGRPVADAAAPRHARPRDPRRRSDRPDRSDVRLGGRRRGSERRGGAERRDGTGTGTEIRPRTGTRRARPPRRRAAELGRGFSRRGAARKGASAGREGGALEDAPQPLGVGRAGRGDRASATRGVFRAPSEMETLLFRLLKFWQ